MSAAGKAMSIALESPDEWLSQANAIVHLPTGMSFLTSSGSFLFDGNYMDGTPRCLGMIERHWLYFKARPIIAKFAHFDPNKEVADRFQSSRAASAVANTLWCSHE